MLKKKVDHTQGNAVYGYEYNPNNKHNIWQICPTGKKSACLNDAAHNPDRRCGMGASYHGILGNYDGKYYTMKCVTEVNQYCVGDRFPCY
jgi:hypothetical protein